MVSDDGEGLPEEVLALIEKAALLNAARHDGKADVGAVIGRALAELPEYRARSGEIAEAAKKAVRRVNEFAIEKQAALLDEKHGGAPAEQQRSGRTGLPPLPNAVRGKACFRLPPEPSGFMTIGHAMAWNVNYIYKQMYDGQLWLRFEDTNPRKVAPAYYESFRKGTAWLGIQWDHEKNVSDDMEEMYSRGEGLVGKGLAYACSCDMQKVKKLRFEGSACEHRDAPVEANLRIWGELVSKKHKEGEFVIRLKGDMKNVNYSLRDPNIFRTIDRSHPLTGDRYSLWPTYHIANVIEDEICGVTHILRSSEFQMDLQQMIRDLLGLGRVDVIQFSRYNFKGTPVSKRLLRPLVESKAVSGWDDPRMPTVEGVMRRGVVPQAIRDFTMQVGYSSAEHEFDWSMLLSLNRKLLDPVSRRMFFVPDPVEVSVEGAPERTVKVPFHPQADLGFRTIETRGVFRLPSSDVAKVAEGSVFRLMDLYNVRVESRAPFRLSYAGDGLTQESRKVQWVAEAGSGAKVLVPGPLFDEKGEFQRDSLKVVVGVCEDSLSSAKAGEIVQFPRFGFCRLDAPGTLVMSC